MTIITFSQLSAFAMVESAECACVINALTGDVVFSKNMNQKHAMASTTKIMTAIVAIERCNMDEIVDVSATAANQEGSAAYISEGNQYYMKDLLYGLMLNSGNDAAVAIAEHVSGSEESFAELMNEKAEELGLGNTHFMNPSGLDNPEHYTTVYNLALIARYAMTLPQFREIVATQTAQVQALNSDEILYFSNHNKMLSLYEGANGIKTGFTKSTGRCLVSSAQRDGMEFIAVTLNDPNDWNDHTEMLDYAFSEHYPKKLIEQGDTVKVIAGKDKGKEGKVVAVDVKKGTVTVEGVNMHTKHTKPSAQNQNGGIVTQEGPINVSNVMLVVKGQVTRVGFKVEDGKKVRIAKKTGDVID